MASRTSSIDSRRIRHGYTLIEAMIASTLLSVTVVAVSGAISASYAQDTYTLQRYQAMQSAMQLLDEVSALPMDSAVPTDPSITNFGGYADEAPVDELGSVVSSSAAPAEPTAPHSKKNARRAVKVTRMTGQNGAASASGDFAIVNVEVENAGQTVQLKRLVTLAETQSMPVPTEATADDSSGGGDGEED